MKKLCRFIVVLASAAVSILTFSFAAQAVTVSPTGNHTDRRAIQAALDTYDEAVLEPGSTYYLGSALHISSNDRLIADGATLICTGGGTMLINDCSHLSTGYNTCSNVVIEGGTWKFKDSQGAATSVIRIAHSRDITIRNITVYCNYRGHSIELIGCKDVQVDNCTLKACGTCPSGCVEEQLQIDLATPRTAPGIAREWGVKYCNGKPCRNITVQNCNITGARALCVNYASAEKEYRRSRNFHRNIRILNNTLVSRSSVACGMFNTVGAVVKGNKIKTSVSGSRKKKVIGLNFYMEGNVPASASGAKTIIEKNTIRSGSWGIMLYSTSRKFGNVTIRNNRIYSRRGKKYCISAEKKSVRKLKKSGNRLHKWK